jgi:lipopolysaccharide exporter
MMAGGTTFSGALVFLAEPVTSRLFPPEAVGVVSTFYAWATILGTIACLRYEMAILLPREEEDAGNILVLSFSILALMTALVFAAVLAAGRPLLGLMHMEALWPSCILLLPAAVFLTGLDLLLRRWHTRHRRFRSIGLSRSMQNIPRVAAEVCGGLAGFTSAVNLAAFRVFGLIGSPANLLYNLLRHDLKGVMRRFTWKGMLLVAGRYVKFPLFESVSALVMLLSLYSPIILLASFFGSDEAGLFSKAFYLLYMPVLILGESTSQAFFQLSSHRRADGEDLGPLVEAVLARIIGLGVLPFALITLAGPRIFGFFLGPWWSEAGLYARIISPWLFVVLVNNSISTLFGTLEHQGIGLIFNLALMTLRVGILIAGGIFIKDPVFTTILFSLASVFVIIWMSGYLIGAVGASCRNLLRHFFYCLLIAVPTLAITAWIQWGLNARPVYVVAAGLISSIPYGVMMIRSDQKLRDLSIRLLKRAGFNLK